ncbi:zinc-ribbon domain-containing protein [Curtobacterium sp. KT1]|uniref:zinc-ribbon domain-containing protein n=1 Tax=Curtobacterium sp. KT1 TaxID=3372858 RepID=UPI0037C07D59
MLVPGVNDFATRYPALAATWHPTDNDVQPDDVFPHGNWKYWWLCETCGERYEKRTAHRIAGTACTSCTREQAAGHDATML